MSRANTLETVLARVDFTLGGCWRWLGLCDRAGYGKVTFAQRQWYVHRLVYTLLVGPIPDGLHLDHVRDRGCRHRDCCNPAHLEPVTPRVNSQRADHTKLTITRCPSGHAYTPENTREYRGRRYCRTCHRERMRRSRSV